jgi:hypothetical protein
MILGFLGWRRSMGKLEPRLKAINYLHEARRYVTSNPEECKILVNFARDEMEDVAIGMVDRLRWNLVAALKYMQVEPDVARGYIDGCAFELNCLEEPKK